MVERPAARLPTSSKREIWTAESIGRKNSPGPSGVVAKTTMAAESGKLTDVFSPGSRHPPRTGSALNLIAFRSEPAFDSVSPIAMLVSPARIFGSQWAARSGSANRYNRSAAADACSTSWPAR